MPRDFDTWNTRENFLSQNPRKASQERFLLVYLVFTCYWRQICSTQLSKPSPKLRSWAPLLVHDATVQVYYRHTVRRLYFGTLEGRFMFSLTFWKLSLDFNLEYLSHFFINFNNQWQFWNPHDEQSSNLSLVFEFAEELTEIIDNEKDEDEINFWKISTVFNLKYLNQNFIKLGM